jgi:transketolase
MRSALSESLVNLADKDPNVVLLTGDHGYSLFDNFRRAHPDRYLNAGIAEQNMVGMAAGMARGGFRPIVYGLSAFIPIRVLEQIKLDVAHDGLPVIFIGDGAGFVYSHLGTSHQSTEDIACARAIPGLSVYSPADYIEMIASMDDAYENASPAYIRVGKCDLGNVHSSPIKLLRNQLIKVKEGRNPKIAFIATGSMVSMAMELEKSSFPGASVWSAPVLKPLDSALVIEICKSSSVIVTLEEHSTFGGLGSLIAEISSESHPVKILRIGVKDRYSLHCGSYEYLLNEHGLNLDAIKNQILSSMKEV